MVDVRAQVDPSGGPLTDSLACVYDFDRDGLWYVVFVRKEGLLAAIHRHSPGFHLFLDDDGDFVFFVRCSGRGEVIDLMGKRYRLSEGAVLLVDADDGREQVSQLKLPLPPCRSADPPSISKAVYELSQDPQVAAFVNPESQARLRGKWEVDKKRQENASSTK